MIASRESARDRAARGAALLDRWQPGWATRIVRELDIADTCNCVLGQVYGSYADGMTVLRPGGYGVGFDWQDAHGFIALSPLGDVTALERAWMAEIRVRSGVLP